MSRSPAPSSSAALPKPTGAMTAMRKGAPPSRDPVEPRMSPRTASPFAALFLAQMAVAACAGGSGVDPRARPPDAVLEVPGSAPRLAACLLAAYAGDPFRFRVADDGTGVRITAFGAPSGRDPRRSRPRFSIEVGQAGRGLVRVALRNARTLLGPGAEIERLRARVAVCGPRGAAANMSKCCQRSPGSPGPLPRVERVAHS